MGPDILLTLITLAVAVVGTLMKDPSKRTKLFLIALAAAASLASIVKAANDESDKQFMRKALISTLRPSNAEYQRVNEEIDSYKDSLGFERYECNHGDDGMTCFLYSPSDPTKHATLVLDSSEVARIYADEIWKGEEADRSQRRLYRNFCTCRP